jgi:hypothetical protein
MTWHYILAKTNPRLLQYQRLTDHPDAATVEDQSKPIDPPGVGATPLPAALPLFATGLGAMGLFGWRRKRKNAAAA